MYVTAYSFFAHQITRNSTDILSLKVNPMHIKYPKGQQGLRKVDVTDKILDNAFNTM